MTSRQAEYISIIYREGSVTKAAQKLNVSQPALSQCIRNAEKDLGAPIFKKGIYPLTLTFAGEKYLNTASEILRLEVNLKSEIHDINHEQIGRIRFGISMLRAATWLPKILPKFEASHPGVDISIIEKGSSFCKSLVLDNVVDLALLSTDQISQSQIVMEPLCIDKNYLIAGPLSNLAQQFQSGSEVSIKVLEDTPVIAVKEGHGVHITQNKIFSALERPPKIKYEIESVVLGIRLVEISSAVLICPYSVLDTIMKPGLSLYPISELNYSNTVCLGYPHNRYQPKYMKDFIRIVKEEIPGEFRQVQYPKRDL